MKFRIRQLSYPSCDHTNPSLKFKRQHKKFCPSNLLSSFLPHSSLKGSQSKLTKSGRDLFSSCTHIVYIQKIALGESPRTNTFPSPSHLPSSTQLSFISFPSPERARDRMREGMGMEGGRELGGKAETRRHKSNLRGLCIPLAYFPHPSLRRWVGED